jgi:hypothetical protein
VTTELNLIELIDRYARTYHRWAQQPANAELDAERKQLRIQIIKTLAERARIIDDHMKQFHAAELAEMAELDAEHERVLRDIRIVSYGPVLNPPHPDWKIASVTPVDPS